MTPDTLHLVVTLVRHFRGIATAIEKWLGKQETSPAEREARQVLVAIRAELTTLETEFGKFEIGDAPAPPEPRDEAEQPIRTGADHLVSPYHLTAVK